MKGMTAIIKANIDGILAICWGLFKACSVDWFCGLTQT